MKFAKCKDLEIINCNYQRLKERKAEIEKENEKIKKRNKNAKTTLALSVLLFTLVSLALTGFLMWFFWTGVLPGIENNTFFTQFHNLNTLYVKYVIEGFILALCLSLYYLELSHIFVESGRNKKTVKPIGDDVVFATVADGRIIGNLTYSKTEEIPYMAQPITFSFDAVNETETEYYSFGSVSSKWRMSKIPGLFKTIIDVGNYIIYTPYIDEDETVNSLEGAYLHEKVQRKYAENKLETIDKEYQEEKSKLKEIAAVAQKQKTVLEDALMKEKEEKETLIKEKELLQKQLKEATDMLYTEQNDRDSALTVEKQKTEAANAEIEALQKKVSDAEAQVSAIQEGYAAKEDECRKLENRLNTALVAEQDAKSELKKVQENYQADLDKKEADYQAKLQQTEEEKTAFKQECEMKVQKAVNEKVKEFESFKGKLNTELDRLQQENQHLREELEEAQNIIGAQKTENETLKASLVQLEHNANADRRYHQNLESKYTVIENRNKVLEKEIAQYQEKEKEWAAATHTIETLRNSITTLENNNATLTKQKKDTEEQLKTVLDTNSPAKMEEMHQRIQTLEKENRSLTQGNNDLRKRNSEMTSAVATAKASLGQSDELKQQNIELKEANEKATADLLSLQKDNVSKQEYITSLEYKLDQANKNLEAVRREIASGNVQANSFKISSEQREKEQADFQELRKKREESLRKAREDAKLAAEKANN